MNKYRGFDIDQLKQEKDFLLNELRSAGATINGTQVRCPFCDDKKSLRLVFIIKDAGGTNAINAASVALSWT